MSKASLETLSAAIAENKTLTSLRLDVARKVSTAPLALALQGRSMHRLALRGHGVDLLHIMDAICDGNLHVQNLILEGHYDNKREPDYSSYLRKLCVLIKFCPNVGALHFTCSTTRWNIKRLSEAIAHTKLLELHIDPEDVVRLRAHETEILIDRAASKFQPVLIHRPRVDRGPAIRNPAAHAGECSYVG